MSASRWKSAPSAGVLVRRHRRPISAALAMGSVLALGLGLMPTPPATLEVVVTAGEIDAGDRLGADHLRVAVVAAGLIPSNAHSDTSGLIGRVSAGPMAAGEVVTDARLLDGPGNLVSPGYSVLPVRLADARAARLLTQGQRISVLAASDSGPLGDQEDGTRQPASAVVLARDALVVSIADAARESGGSSLFDGPGASGDGGDSGLVVLRMESEAALAVAGAQATHRLSYTLG